MSPKVQMYLMISLAVGLVITGVIGQLLSSGKKKGLGTLLILVTGIGVVLVILFFYRPLLHHIAELTELK